MFYQRKIMAKFTNFILVVVFLYFATVEARNKTPLLDEESSRVRSRNAECVFGKEVKELGSQWIPDLGIPIGVLYCMRCECMPLQRKNRIVARVRCRNIESECPAVTCDEPVLKKGQCCKMCPDTNHSPNEGLDIVARQPAEDEEKNNKHFSALLTGRSSLVLRNELMPNDINKNNIVATGRFTFTKKNLHYSFYVSEKAARPRQLQFRDNLGNILEEFTLSQDGGQVNSLYQNATRKVCGVWRRVPREYRRLLKQGRMYVVLIWGIKNDSEFTLSGQILKYVPLASETFSSLLEPAPGTNSELMLGSGGTAIVSISTSVPSSLHLAIIFNGLFTPDETSKVQIRVTLSMDEKKQILNQVVTVDKTSYALNLIELSAPIELPALRSLTRGKLMLTVASVSSPIDLRLTGNVITKVTCELFQTVLSSSPSDVSANPNGTSGLAWLYLNNDGSMVYNIHIDNLKLSTYALTMSDVSTKRKTELEDFSPDFKMGWANGTLDKLSPKYLDPLYSGNMAISLQTSTENLIRGKLSAKHVDDARDSPAPVLLKREGYYLPTSAAGLAWISVDNECHIHYDVSLSGIEKIFARKFELSLELLPMLAPGAPVIVRHLDNFEGSQAEGSPIEILSTEEISRLSNGVCFLKVKDFESKNVLLIATLKQMNVPGQCRYYNNNIPLTYNGDPATMPAPPGTCFYEGKFYEEEKQWISTENSCKTCFCQNGVANCDVMTCPKLNCGNSEPIKVEDECCPVCSDMIDTNKQNQSKCSLNGKMYYPGAKFHPFLIPTGFDKCTECTCDPVFLEIRCQRLSEKLCCSNCSEQTSYNVQSDVTPSERKELPDVEKVLKEGGCKNSRDHNKPFVNNSTYHPFIDSLGEYKCVTCTCRNGNQECKRETCDLEACNRRREKRRKKEPIKDICCSAKECKKLRHKKNRL